MVVVTDVAAGFTSLKAAFDLTQAMIGLGVGQAAKAKIGEVQERLFEAQQTMFAVNEARSALIARVGELEKDLAALKEWDREKQRYRLTEIRPGFYAYRLKPEEAGAEPAHDLCAQCYQANKKGFLQGERLQFRGYETVRCDGCGAELRYFRSDLPKAPPLRKRDSNW